jgi:carbonic anhydrase/acetyltransferase-like protein (isoleucine patch superfamily)
LIIINSGIVLFIIMLLLPLMSGYVTYKRYPGKPIYINQKREKDPRYFAHSFSQMFEKKWKNYDGTGSILLSHEESIIESDKIKEYSEVCESVIFAENEDFSPPERRTVFIKEIYAKKNAYIHGELQIRAIACIQNMYISNGTEIIRWVDAEGLLVIGDHCNLGISATSGLELVVGKNCKFHRLYAPKIRIGQYHDKENSEPLQNKDPKIYRLVPKKEIKRNLKYLDDTMLNENNIADFSIVSKHDVVILEDLILQGHIRSQKGVQICDNAVVCGNIFAEEDIVIGINACILGNIFTQGNITFEKGAVVGQKDRIYSIISRGRIEFAEDSFVYGYVSSEAGGVICYKKLTDNELETERNNTKQTDLLLKPVYRETLEIKDLKEYNAIDPLGFRHEPHIKKVIIPEGVERINASMFFMCQALETIELPSSIKIIDDFAFYGCEKLKEIQLQKLVNLEIIGKSAFEGCQKLNEIIIPSSIHTIKPAAFLGCSEIKSVEINQKSQLMHLSDHVFKECRSLERVALPNEISEIGLSGFYGCQELVTVTMPEKLETIEGYAFNGCTNLKEIIFFSKVKTIGEYAFHDCLILDELRVNDPELVNQPGLKIGFPETIKLIVIGSKENE